MSAAKTDNSRNADIVKHSKVDLQRCSRENAQRGIYFALGGTMAFAFLIWRCCHLFGLSAIISFVANPSPTHGSPLLTPFKFRPLPLGSIKPRGWLQDQMQLMADGLYGHEHDFYRFVSESTWTGGDQEYSSLNEAFPYWFNGIVPLAYGLDDERLRTQVKIAVDSVLERRAKDGWLGPEVGKARNFWARYPLLLGFIQLLEADFESYEETVLPAMHDFLSLMNTMLRNNGTGYLNQPDDPLSEEDHGWGRIRFADALVSLQWLYENHADGQEELLLENMDMLNQGAIDWAAWYQEGVYIKQDLNMVPTETTAPLFPYEHGVNVGQGLKTGAVINRFAPNAFLVTMARRAVEWTFRYHSSPSGTILADERLSGLAPFYGSELCTTVETMYSLAYLYQSLGDNSFADRAETAAFNALPAAVMPNWWAHQYVSQPNQPYAKELNDTPFWNVNGVGQTFGLEPNYPCCTVNHGQGYPKFLANSFVRTERGLAHVLLSPGIVDTAVGDGAGTRVTVECETSYPFDSTLSYIITASAPFELSVRIPSWATTPATTSNGSTLTPDPDSGLHTLALPSGLSTFTLTLNHSIRTTPRANNSISIFAGPLLYALDLNTSTSSTPASPFNPSHPFSNPSRPLPSQARDYTIVNTSPWNIAIDPSTLSLHSHASSSSNGKWKLQNPIWTPHAPPTWMEAQGCEIDWPVYKGAPGPVPPREGRKCVGDVRTVKLIPYGSAKVHMSELPTIDLAA